MDGLLSPAMMIGVVDFGVETISRARGIYKSKNGASEEWLVQQKFLQQRLKQLRNMQCSRDGSCDQLTGLITRGENLLKEVTDVIDKLSVGRHRAYRSFVLALEQSRRKPRYEDIKERLMAFHNEFSLYSMQHMSEQLNQKLAMVQNVQTDPNIIAEKFLKRLGDMGTIIWTNRQVPPDLAYLPETGDYVAIDDGLDPRKYKLPLDFCSSPEALIFHIRGKFHARALPGLGHVEKGLLIFLDYTANTRLSDDNWSQYVISGVEIKMAFVMGTWHGLPIEKCARCSTAFRVRASRRGWRNCNSCGLKLQYVPPDAFPYEPPDMEISPEVWEEFQQKKNLQSGTEQYQEKTNDTEVSDAATNDSHASNPTEPHLQRSRSGYATSIDLWARRLIVKWEPIFNITFRYMICRCPVYLSTPSHFEWNPEMTILLCVDCPRHNDEGLRRKDYGDIVNNATDPYFDRFGGYDAFRGVLSSQRSRWEVLGGEKFLRPADIPEAQAARKRARENQPDAVTSAWRKYDCENLEKLVQIGIIRPEDISDDEAILLSEFKGQNGGRHEKDDDFEKDMATWPCMQDVNDILQGRWNGIPHWE